MAQTITGQQQKQQTGQQQENQQLQETQQQQPIQQDQPAQQQRGSAAYERSPLTSSLVEVIDRVLDKGIVIDAWVRISLVGIELLTIEARVVVASVDTYLRYADALGRTRRIAG